MDHLLQREANLEREFEMDKSDGRKEALRFLAAKLPKELKTLEANIEALENWKCELSIHTMQESRIVLTENKIGRLRVRKEGLIVALEWVEEERKSEATR